MRQVLRKQVTHGAVSRSCMTCSTTAIASTRWPASLAALAREHGGVNAAHYRDAIGLGRKRTIQILEFFDRIGYTRRVHDVHVLRRTAAGGRYTHPVVRLGFKPSRGRQTLPGRFDSCCLPPFREDPP